MKRKKYSEIITKEDRDEFLKYLMERELEKIRKKIYKYKRCNAIWYPITIEEIEFEDNRTAGCYIWDEKNEVHKIYIANILVKNYITEFYCTYVPKVFDKVALKSTIGHELTHALVQEQFEYTFSDIKEKNRDGSPVFLATLQYLGYNSGHRCCYNYRGSKVCKDIDKLKKNNETWDKFRIYIYSYLRDLNSIREKFNTEHRFLGQTIDFRFSHRGSGLRKVIQSTAIFSTYIKNKRKLIHTNITNTIFEIGSIMHPELIEKLLPKKLNNGVSADIFEVGYEKLIADDNIEHNKCLYKKEEVYNKYSEQKVA